MAGALENTWFRREPNTTRRIDYRAFEVAEAEREAALADNIEGPKPTID